MKLPPADFNVRRLLQENESIRDHAVAARCLVHQYSKLSASACEQVLELGEDMTKDRKVIEIQLLLRALETMQGFVLDAMRELISVILVRFTSDLAHGKSMMHQYSKLSASAYEQILELGEEMTEDEKNIEIPRVLGTLEIMQRFFLDAMRELVAVILVRFMSDVAQA